VFEQLITIIFVAVVLGLDAFSLALGYGMRGISRKNIFKFTLIITLYHILMPFIGIRIGLAAGKLLGIWAARLGGLALAYIGFEMLVKGYREIKTETMTFAEARASFASATQNNIKGRDMLLLGFLVSIDALTAGFGLGTLRVSVPFTCLIIGIVAGIMSLTGFLGGRLISRIVGSYAQIAGALILLILAAKMLIQGGI
jgi:putative Mn2+ efflux pump MntP